MTKPQLIVFSDLDGTLLDHDSYSFAPAQPALQALKARAIPVILASSKTGVEISLLRDAMGLSAYPAIVENGSGVLQAGAAPVETGPVYAQIREALRCVPPELRQLFVGFGDMTAEAVATATGLPQKDAKAAKARAFSEPGLWQGDDQERQSFEAALAELGVAARYGGRFLTLSLGQTKAGQMAAIAKHYEATAIIALGDAPNDAEMLAAADHPILIQNPHAKPLPDLPKKAAKRLRKSTKPGPAGWNQEILDLLSELQDSL